MSLLAMRARSPAANSGQADLLGRLAAGRCFKCLTASDTARGKFHSILYDKHTGNNATSAPSRGGRRSPHSALSSRALACLGLAQTHRLVYSASVTGRPFSNEINGTLEKIRT